MESNAEQILARLIGHVGRISRLLHLGTAERRRSQMRVTAGLIGMAVGILACGSGYHVWADPLPSGTLDPLRIPKRSMSLTLSFRR